MYQSEPEPASDVPADDRRSTADVGEPVAGQGVDLAGHSTWIRLTDQLSWYSRASRSAKLCYQRLKVAELIIGAAVPVVAALSAPAAVTAVLAALVVVAEGVQHLYGWQANWVLYRGTLEALKREKFLFLAEVGRYGCADRLTVLADRVETLLAAQNLSWSEAFDSGTSAAATPTRR